MKKSQRAAQARRELDRKFESMDVRSIRVRPRSGWIRAVRGGLGMSQQALADRLGISGPSVVKLERSELNDTISIGKLAQIARSLDCTLVYALVPNASLEDTVQRQARRAAARTLGYVATTMQLEDQALEPGQEDDQLEAYAEMLVESNRVWRSE